MGQRLVLKTSKKRLSLKEMKQFVTVAEQYGVPLSEEVDVTSSRGELLFTKSLPKMVRVVDGKKYVLRPKSKRQKQVEKQIKEHKEKPVEEKKYVPPVGRTTAPSKTKIKCPVCNVRKPVQKIGGVSVVKPHVSKGDPCPGSGTQV